MTCKQDVRIRIEEREEGLSFFATKSRNSRGRLKWEAPDPIRTCFQRDRDRIIHSKAFRRLKHKTQVFIAPLGDHFVTRLTHTLEVSQIARTLARALNLNEDLAEAVSLGHDLGHTPFGHIGEEVLNELSPGGFRHNEHGLRVVDVLEKDGQGLNLTLEVRDGIVDHSKGQSLLEEGWQRASTLEGEVCKIADVVAYINHDIGDALRAGVIREDALPASAVSLLGHSHSERINSLVCDIVGTSWNVSSAGPTDDKAVINMSPPVLKEVNSLRQFLFEKVYNPSLVRAETLEARRTVRFLYSYFLSHEAALPIEYSCRDDSIEQKVCDYVAGMTDLYALRVARDLGLQG